LATFERTTVSVRKPPAVAPLMWTVQQEQDWTLLRRQEMAANARSEVRLVVEAEVASENAGAQALFSCFHIKKCSNVSK
jgi:hypothetical protein